MAGRPDTFSYRRYGQNIHSFNSTSWSVRRLRTLPNPKFSKSRTPTGPPPNISSDKRLDLVQVAAQSRSPQPSHVSKLGMFSSSPFIRHDRSARAIMSLTAYSQPLPRPCCLHKFPVELYVAHNTDLPNWQQTQVWHFNKHCGNCC